jgi:CRISPR-associated protein Cst2
MSLHIFANIVTSYGTAANNRAENEGNITTLQKLIWQGQPHSTVSAEAIRFALRRLLATEEEAGTNRTWDEDERVNGWKDDKFKGWADKKAATFIDDDLLGFMTADAANAEGEAGSANVRRAVLEVTRAISLTPWAGDVTFNAASPGATASASKGANKNKNPVPYGTEVHATRYQFGVAMTPARLNKKDRAIAALRSLCSLRTVAGNHGRFLFDFSPDAVVFRITDDPAPRLLYCFDTPDAGKTVTAESLLKRVKNGDVLAAELIVGVSDVDSELAKKFVEAKVPVKGVKAAMQDACTLVTEKLHVK